MQSLVLKERRIPDNMPHNSRIWIFQADRFFSIEEEQKLAEEMNRFANIWTSHSSELWASGCIKNKCHLIFLVDEENGPAISGCSMDKMTHFVQNIGEQLHIDFFNRLRLLYKINDELQFAEVHELKGLLVDQKINANTLFFNNLVKTKKDWDQQWLVPMNSFWLKKYLKNN